MEWWLKAKQLIGDQGVSMASVAKRSGWAESTLSNQIRGKNEPSASRGLALAKALGVPAEWLFDDKAGWPPPVVRSDEVAMTLAAIGAAFSDAAERTAETVGNEPEIVKRTKAVLGQRSKNGKSQKGRTSRKRKSG